MSGWMDNNSRMGGNTGEWMVEGWVARGQAGHLPHVASLSDRGGDDKDDDQQDSDSSRQKVALDLATLEPEREAVVSQAPESPIPGGIWLVPAAGCGMQGSGHRKGAVSPGVQDPGQHPQSPCWGRGQVCVLGARPPPLFPSAGQPPFPQHG